MKYKVVSDGVLFYVAKKVWWWWVIVGYPYHYKAEAQERADELNGDRNG